MRCNIIKLLLSRSAELLTRKEIFIYVYGNYYLRVEKYLFTRK